MINGPHKSQFLSCVIAYSLSPGSMSIVYFALANIPVISFFCMIDFVRVFRRKFLQKVLCFLYDFQSFNLNYSSNRSHHYTRYLRSSSISLSVTSTFFCTNFYWGGDRFISILPVLNDDNVTFLGWAPSFRYFYSYVFIIRVYWISQLLLSFHYFFSSSGCFSE